MGRGRKAQLARGRRALIVAGLLHGAVATAESPDAPTEPAPQVDLQQLLKLPSSLDYSVESRGGYTRGEWRDRFETMRQQLVEARDALRSTQAELEEAASSSAAWTVAPPGTTTSPSEQPLDFKLRQEIRRQREEIERLERRERALEVEANLAGVPPEWRN